MLTFEERIENIEALVVKLANEAEKNKLATYDDDLDAIATELFNKQRELTRRITALKNNTDIVKNTIT